MTHRDIAAVRGRLEETVAALPGEPTGPADLYERTLMVCQLILDSEAYDYAPEGALEALLASYMHIRQIELALLPFTYSQET